eukprot:4423714-Amphidinium_carterae.1
MVRFRHKTQVKYQCSVTRPMNAYVRSRECALSPSLARGLLIQFIKGTLVPNRFANGSFHKIVLEKKVTVEVLGLGGRGAQNFTELGDV